MSLQQRLSVLIGAGKSSQPTKQAVQYSIDFIKFISKLGFIRNRSHRNVFGINVSNRSKGVRIYRKLEKQLKIDGYSFKPPLFGRALIISPSDAGKPELDLYYNYNSDKSLTIEIVSDTFNQVP
jgi:hypothetical protein